MLALRRTCVCRSAAVRAWAACLLVGMVAAPVWARPSAMKLFPEETLLLMRTSNVHELVAALKETATGRMMRDPQLEPLIDRLYGGAGDLYGQWLADMLGVSWEGLQQLPEGEVAFGIVARRDSTPALLLLIDQGSAPSVAGDLLEAALDGLQQRGGEFSTEQIEEVEVTVVRDSDNQDRVIGLFEKENTIVVATDAGLVGEVLRHWAGDDQPGAAAAAADPSATSEDSAGDLAPEYSGRTLAENPRFVSIVRQCRRAQDPPPNILIYLDPIGLVRQFGREDAGLKIATATFPALGIDGLEAVGGTLTLATGQYDDLCHYHVLLGNPRSGVMQLIAFQPGDITPQPWVPADVETYMTWHWNGRATFDMLVGLIDRFQYAGAADEHINEIVSEPLGIDLELDVIDNLAGRFSWLVGYDQPATARGQMSLLAVELHDPAAAEQTLANLVARFPERFEQRQFGNVTYEAIVLDWPDEMPEVRRPIDPLVAVVDDYLLVGTSCQLLERSIEARDGTVERLADVPEYAMLADQVRYETPGVTPAMWMYSDFEHTLRHWYDLLNSEQAQEFLEERADSNPLFAALADALAAGELPPFEVLARYSFPSVGVVYDTDTGYHGLSFTLRSEAEPAAP